MLNEAKRLKWSNLTSKIIDLLEYPLAFLLILTSNSVYFKSEGFHGFRILQVSFLIMLAIVSGLSVLYLVFAKKNSKTLITFLAVYAALFLLFCFLSSRVYPLSKNVILIMFVIPVLSIIYLHYCSNSNVLNNILFKIENLTIVLAVISLIMWLLGPILNIIHATNYLAISWGGTHGITSFYNIFFAAQGQIDFFGVNITRNTGIFVEAPVYAFILIAALLINLFLEKKNWIKLSVLLLTILSTTSTTGLILAILALSIKLVTNKRIYGIIPKKIRLYGIVLISTTVFICAIILIQKKMGSISYSSRINDFYAGFKAWLQHPFIGNGVGNYKSITQYMAPSRLLQNGNKGFSTGLMKVLAEGGIYLISFYVLPILIVIKKYWRTRVNLVTFSILLFAVFVITIVNDTYLFIFLVTWLWASAIFKNTKSGLNKAKF